MRAVVCRYTDWGLLDASSLVVRPRFNVHIRIPLPCRWVSWLRGLTIFQPVFPSSAMLWICF